MEGESEAKFCDYYQPITRNNSPVSVSNSLPGRFSKLVTLGLIKEIAKSKTDPTKYYELL